jgi:hypothetical protein
VGWSLFAFCIDLAMPCLTLPAEWLEPTHSCEYQILPLAREPAPIPKIQREVLGFYSRAPEQKRRSNASLICPTFALLLRRFRRERLIDISVSHEDGGAQRLVCHVRCLEERLHPSVPVVSPEDDGTPTI